MHLKSLSLRQFRNFAQLDLAFSPGLNVLVGSNGSGKSNILEAVAVLCTAQSHRGADAKHMIQWEKDGFSLKGVLEGDPDGDLTLEMKQKTGRPRIVTVDGKAQRRSRDWVGRAGVVSFSPDDLFLVKGEPSQRRRALNALLCQVDGDYFEALTRYTKIVAERNAALRAVGQGNLGRGDLIPWTLSLVKEGAALTLARRDFIPRLSALVQENYQRLSSQKEEVKVAYKPSFHDAEGGLSAVMSQNQQRLKELQEAEIAVGATLLGPHRDDLDFFLGGHLAREHASQGQSRSLALALKLAEEQHLFNRKNQHPIFIWDDVLSELDPSRRQNLSALLSTGTQSFVSLTSLSDWPQVRRHLEVRDAAVFDVAEGRVTSAPPINS